MFGLMHNLYKYTKKKREKRVTLVFIGIDNAGKTTLLSTIRNERNAFTTPTVGFDSKTVVIGSHICTMFDLGGGKNIRQIWDSYYSEVHGAIYVVDAADEARMEEAKQCLHEALNFDCFKGKPILVFANKQDLPQALSAPDVSARLGLDELPKSAHNIMPCVALAKEDKAAMDERISKGVKWLLASVDKDFSNLATRVERDVKAQKEQQKKEREERRKRVEAMRAERKRKEEEEEKKAAEEAENQKLDPQEQPKQEVQLPSSNPPPAGEAGPACNGEKPTAEQANGTNGAGPIAPTPPSAPAPETPPTPAAAAPAANAAEEQPGPAASAPPTGASEAVLPCKASAMPMSGGSKPLPPLMTHPSGQKLTDIAVGVPRSPNITEADITKNGNGAAGNSMGMLPNQIPSPVKANPAGKLPPLSHSPMPPKTA